jgi:hypothetical protein
MSICDLYLTLNSSKNQILTTVFLIKIITLLNNKLMWKNILFFSKNVLDFIIMLDYIK